MADQPNVLFIFGDQHRRDALGCAGNDEVQSPNFDSLAEDGSFLTHAYATDPVCGPGRGCLMSGQFPTTSGMLFNGMALPDDGPTMGKAFRDAGYRTGYIGKWHLESVPFDEPIPPGPRRLGFEDFWAVNHSAHDYFDAEYYRGDDSTPVQGEGYTPAVQADLTIECFEEHREEPLCCMLSLGPPHGPYGDVPEAFRERYDADDLSLRPNVEPIPSEFTVDNTTVRETLANYYAHVTAMDHHVGRVLDYLEETGQAENTIVVYTADHGDMLWSHGQWGKGYPWEESVGIPFLIRWPDEIPAGEENDTLLGLVDMAPTMLGLAGEEPPAAMDGKDRSAALRGEAEGPESLLLMRACTSALKRTDKAAWRGIPKPEWRAIRTHRYTFARLQDGSDWLLYDNEADPYQRRNLVSEPEYDDLRADLSEQLAAHLDAIDDEFQDGEDLARDLGVLDDLNRTLEWHMGPEARVEE
jgi:arylsulfatase A-like enzyme